MTIQGSRLVCENPPMIEHTLRQGVMLGYPPLQLFPGEVHIRNKKGYWYAMDLEYGQLKRVRYVSHVSYLNALYNTLRDEQDE